MDIHDQAIAYKLSGNSSSGARPVQQNSETEESEPPPVLSDIKEQWI